MVTITDDGILFAKNSDRDPNEAQHLDWMPPADHPAGARLRATWVEIDQVPHTHAVLLSRPWWIWGAEMGANEHGLVIGNEAVFTRGHREPSDGLIGMDLLRLALERAATAHDAVEVIVSLLEAHGQAGSCSRVHPKFSYDNSFLIADPNGAIVLETAGRRWATEEVRGGARSISNSLTIAGFAEAHADPVRTRVAQGRTRRARTQASATAATGVLDLFAALRDHGPTGLPVYSPLNGALAAPCAHAGGLLTSTQTTASWVADLRGTPQHWVTATAAPCTSVFKPVRVDEPVELGPTPTDRFDDRTLWWRHERLHRATMIDPATLLPRYRHQRDLLEATWVADPPESATAFEHAERLDAAWLDDVLSAGQPDRRPRLVRRLWDGWTRNAGMLDVVVHP